MTAPRRTPDFLVVGAPKCGTTALHHYLRQHPGLFVPPTKEPHFFARDVHLRWRISDPEEYAALFEEAAPDAVTGEVSVWYLASATAAAEILDSCGPIRIVAMLRNPIDAMHSWHDQLVYNGDEPLTSFRDALDAEEPRRNGRRLPEGFTCDPAFFAYRRLFDYEPQLERYFDRFGPERIHLSLLEEWREDPQAAFDRVVSFLGREPVAAEFPRLNPSKKVRRPWLRRLYRATRDRVRPLARHWIRDERRWRQLVGPVADTARSLWTEHVEREPMDPALRAELVREWAPRVESLGRFLGRDFAREWPDFEAGS